MFPRPIISESLLKAFFTRHPDIDQANYLEYIQDKAPQVRKIDALWQLEMIFKPERINFDILLVAHMAANFVGISPICFFLLIGGNANDLTPFITKYPHQFSRCSQYAQNNMGHYAAMSGKIQSVLWVAAHFPALMTSNNRRGDNLLHVAMLRDNKDVVEWLASHYPILTWRRHGEPGYMTHYAAASGSVRMMKWVQSNHMTFTLFEIDKNGNLPIHIAVKRGHVEMLKWFLKQDVSMANRRSTKQGLNALELAAVCGQIKCAEVILKEFPFLIKVRHPELGTSCAHMAAAGGNIAMLQLILQRHPELWHSRDKYGRNMLHHAIMNGQMTAVVWIHEHYPELLTQDLVSGQNTLSFAKMFNDAAIIAWVKEHYPTLVTRLRKWWDGEPYAIEGVPDAPPAFAMLGEQPADWTKADDNEVTISHVGTWRREAHNDRADAWTFYSAAPVTIANPFYVPVDLS